MRTRYVALAAAAIFAAGSAFAEPVKVKTKSGTLVGEQSDGVKAFKGVPYAQPPVGMLRWAPPRVTSWTGDRPATQFTLPCSQPVNADGKPNGAGVTGGSQEDCLHLNVWAPANAKNAPVMLWLQ